MTRLAAPKRVVRLDGPRSTPSAVIRELPRARWVHFDTHGFFEDAGVKSALSPDANPLDQFRVEGMAGIARTPLVLSGLLLGAPDQPTRDGEESSELLTAEAVAGLSLPDLDLAVLSACDTGLGTVVVGEGVFGLQRAFHLAGARSVLATLWEVPSDATETLIAEFYTNLWQKKLSTIEALRQAQLTLLKDRRRLDRSTVTAPKGVDALSSAARGEPRLPTRRWAGFVLSGDWR